MKFLWTNALKRTILLHDNYVFNIIQSSPVKTKYLKEFGSWFYSTHRSRNWLFRALYYGITNIAVNNFKFFVSLWYQKTVETILMYCLWNYKLFLQLSTDCREPFNILWVGRRMIPLITFKGKVILLQKTVTCTNTISSLPCDMRSIR